MKPSEIIPLFDVFLSERGLSFEAVVIGGAALELLGIIGRETQDCDVLDPEIPIVILNAAKDFAKLHSVSDTVLKETWLNNGPSSLVKNLPKKWGERVVPVFEGKAIVLQSLGRLDLLKTKLFALCDRGQDLDDCIALNPTRDELHESLEWVTYQDANLLWPNHVRSSFKHLGKKLGYEF